MRILGISGSLRRESSNGRLLEAAGALMPESVTYEIADCIDRLPHFNPDVDISGIEVVQAWVEQVKVSDGIIISTPEYARGYPGSLKNALDWLVQTDAHIDKPFMLLNASARSRVAQDTLTTVLKTMSGIQVNDATVPLLGKSLGTQEILADPALSSLITSALLSFVAGIDEMRRGAIL